MNNNVPCVTSKENKKARKCSTEVFLKEGEKRFSNRKIPEFEHYLTDAVGTPNFSLASHIMDSFRLTLPKRNTSEENYNIALQAFTDSCPKDANEARLIAQADASYTHGMEYFALAREVLVTSEVPAKDHWHSIYMKSATRCFDIHTKTIDTLNRYRQKGEQRVVVQHVTVQDGGKAVVSNVLPGGGG